MESGAVRIEELLAHATWVQGLASRLVSDPTAADDVTQEVWARALRSPPRTRANLRGWLAATVRTTVLALRRGQERRRVREEAARVERDEPGAAELVERAQLHQRLVEHVLSLAEPNRAIVLAHWFEGQSLVAIAERHGTTPRVVKARLEAAHAELRRRLDEGSGGRSAWLGAFVPWTHPHVAASSTIGWGSSPVLGGVLVVTKGKLSIAFLLAFLLWLGLRNGSESPTPDEGNAAPVSAEKPPMVAAATLAEDRGAVRTLAESLPEGFDAMLEVHVTDAFTMQPIPNASVKRAFERTRTDAQRSALEHLDRVELGRAYSTNELGVCVVPASSSLALVLFVHAVPLDEGSAIDVAALTAGERRIVKAEVNHASDVHCFARVLRREDQRPVEGAVATFVLNPPPQRSTTQATLKHDEPLTEEVATSDSRGWIELSARSWSLRCARIHANGYAPVILFPSGQGTRETAQIVLLDRGAAIEARVLDLGGAPVAGASLRLTTDPKSLVQLADDCAPGAHALPEASWSGFTGTDGRCTIDDLPAGLALQPNVSKAGLLARGAPDPFVLAAGEQRTVELRLGATCMLGGRVLDSEGKPLAGVPLWLKPLAIDGRTAPRADTNYFLRQYGSSIEAETRSDTSGNYRFESVAPGPFWIGPACASSADARTSAGDWAPVADTIVIPDTAWTFEHDVILQPARYVRGQVLDPEGKPVRTSVRMSTAAGSTVWIDSSGQDGRFVAGPVGEGDFLLRADVVPGGSFAVSEELLVHAGDVDVVLKLRCGAMLTATLVDDASGDVCAGQVILSLRGSGAVGRHVNLSNDPTRFQLQGIVPGLYDVIGRARDGRIGVVRGVALSAPSHAELVVRVSPAAKLTFRCEGKYAWGALLVRSGEAEVVRSSIQRGAPSAEFVPAGPLVIEYWPLNSGDVQRRELDLRAGEEQEIVFRDDG